MKLSKVQKEALDACPLFFGQSETNLNKFYWASDTSNRDFQPRTVQSLIEKGLVEFGKKGEFSEDRTVVYKVDDELFNFKKNK